VDFVPIVLSTSAEISVAMLKVIMGSLIRRVQHPID
jgi:hypothetical protein